MRAKVKKTRPYAADAAKLSKLMDEAGFLTITAGAEALDISSRALQYHLSGNRPVPRQTMLAMTWLANKSAYEAMEEAMRKPGNRY